MKKNERLDIGDCVFFGFCGKPVMARVTQSDEDNCFLAGLFGTDVAQFRFALQPGGSDWEIELTAEVKKRWRVPAIGSEHAFSMYGENGEVMITEIDHDTMKWCGETIARGEGEFCGHPTTIVMGREINGSGPGHVFFSVLEYLPAASIKKLSLDRGPARRTRGKAA